MNSKYQTERLIIRPTNTEDADFIFNLFNTPKWIENIGNRNIASTHHAKQYIETIMLGQFNQLGYSSYTIIKQSDNEKIGTVGLYDREGVDGIDFGFAFLPQFEGNSSFLLSIWTRSPVRNQPPVSNGVSNVHPALLTR